MPASMSRNTNLEQNNNCKLSSPSHQEFMMDVQLTRVRVDYNINVPMLKIVLKAWKRLSTMPMKSIMEWLIKSCQSLIMQTMLKLRKL